MRRILTIVVLLLGMLALYGCEANPRADAIDAKSREILTVYLDMTDADFGSCGDDAESIQTIVDHFGGIMEGFMDPDSLADFETGLLSDSFTRSLINAQCAGLASRVDAISVDLPEDLETDELDVAFSVDIVIDEVAYHLVGVLRFTSELTLTDLIFTEFSLAND